MGKALRLMRKRKDYNMLEQAEKACAEVGIGLWCFWHSNLKSLSKQAKQRFKKYMVRDANGDAYSYHVDLLNPKVLEYAKKVIDELAVRYNKNGALKGVFLDELWHPFATDYMEDDVDKFIKFCEREYQTTPPADIADKFSKGPSWHDPEDVWWRRYLIWRDTHTAKFTEEVTKHANSKGLQVMAQPAFPLTWDMGWFWGAGNSKRICKTGDLLWSYEGRFNFIYEDYPENRTIFATHTNAHSGFSMVSLIRGNYGSQFALNSSWAPVLFGKSTQGRDISLISLPSRNENALNFFIQARDHAYETAGSYCVEGIVDFLCEKSFISEYLRSKYSFFVLPMTNPDGVYNGLSRLTHENGFNLDRLWWNNGPGAEGRVLLDILDHFRPSVYMNIHNYAMKFVDGLLTCQPMGFVEKICQHLPADHEHHKNWFVMTDDEWCKRNNTKEYLEECWGGKNYCKNHFDSLSVIFELTWFGRNTELMKERGTKAMTALALAAVEELKI